MIYTRLKHGDPAFAYPAIVTRAYVHLHPNINSTQPEGGDRSWAKGVIAGKRSMEAQALRLPTSHCPPCHLYDLIHMILIYTFNLLPSQDQFLVELASRLQRTTTPMQIVFRSHELDSPAKSVMLHRSPEMLNCCIDMNKTSKKTVILGRTRLMLSEEEQQLIDDAGKLWMKLLAKLNIKVSLHTAAVEHAKKALDLVSCFSEAFSEAVKNRQTWTARCEKLEARLRELKVRQAYLDAKVSGIPELECVVLNSKKEKLTFNKEVWATHETRVQQCLSSQRRSLETFLR